MLESDRKRIAGVKKKEMKAIKVQGKEEEE